MSKDEGKRTSLTDEDGVKQVIGRQPSCDKDSTETGNRRTITAIL